MAREGVGRDKYGDVGMAVSPNQTGVDMRNLSSASQSLRNSPVAIDSYYVIYR